MKEENKDILDSVWKFPFIPIAFARYAISNSSFGLVRIPDTTGNE